MTDLRKAADLALQALDIWEDGLTDPYANFGWRFACIGKEAQEALRQALAQPKREWVGMTDKELSTLSVSAGIISWSKHDYLADKKQLRELPIDEGMDGDKVCLMQFAQLIEAKLKEKNT